MLKFCPWMRVSCLRISSQQPKQNLLKVCSKSVNTLLKNHHSVHPTSRYISFSVQSSLSSGQLAKMAALPTLDREAFNQILTLGALRVPAAECQKYMKLLEGYAPNILLTGQCMPRSMHLFLAVCPAQAPLQDDLGVSPCRHTFNKPRMRCIIPDADNKTTRLLLLSEEESGPGACPKTSPSPAYL